MSVSVRMMRGRREERYRFLPDTQPREQRGEKLQSRPSRSQELASKQATSQAPLFTQEIGQFLQ